jgi:hypothetical protein
MAENELPRCGDTVRHIPSGEEWTVAYAEGNELAPAGWPDSRGNVSDCEIVRRCTDDEHQQAVRDWSMKSSTDSRRANVLRLYRKALW